MTKENKYCDDDSKIWTINCNGKEIRPSFVSGKNAMHDKFPELNFEEDGKEFILQFENGSDLVGCRDSGKDFTAYVCNLNRTKRIKATVKHQKL